MNEAIIIENENKNTERVFGLDLLRAFAILTVVYGHGGALLEKYIDLSIYNRFIFDGVTIFFVLSGFLIGGILLKTLDSKNFTFSELMNFWKRRWFRTLPNYFLILFCLILIDFFFLQKGIPYNRFQYFFFLQNIYLARPAFFDESWSLSVEEWFYLAIPFFITVYQLFLGRKYNKEFLFALTITFIVIITIFRIYRASITGIDYSTIWFSVTTRLDSIMYGFLGAYLKFYHYPLWSKYKKIFLLMGLFLLLLFNTPIHIILTAGNSFRAIFTFLYIPLPL